MKKLVILLSIVCFISIWTVQVEAESETTIEVNGLENAERINLKFKNSIEETKFSYKILRDGYFNYEQRLISLPKAYVTDPEIQQFMRANELEYIEPDITRHATGLVDFNSEWDYKSLGLKEFTKRATFKEEVIVAVVDTGVDTTSEDLKGHLLPAINALEGTTSLIDDAGHGTHVAGIVLRASHGAPVKILPVKALDGDNGGTDFEVANGIRYATDNGADVINLSLGARGASMTQKKAIEYAISKGVFVVVSAGNDNTQIYNYYPASEEAVMTVGALDENLKRAEFSNFGNTLDIVAPGVGISSTFIKARDTSDGKVDGYTKLSGTSMSAPFVTGIVAAIKSAYPNLTNEEIEILLKGYAQDLYETGFDEQSGFGLANLEALDLSKPLLFVNKGYVVQNEALQVATYNLPEGSLKVFINDQLLHELAVTKNGLHEVSVGDISGESASVKLIYEDTVGRQILTETSTLQVLDDTKMKIFIKNHFGKDIQPQDATIYGVKDGRTEVISFIHHFENNTIDTSKILRDYDTYYLTLTNDSSNFVYFIVREVKLNETLYIDMKDLVKIKLDLTPFSLPSIEEYNKKSNQVPPLLQIGINIDPTNKVKLVFAKNMLLPYEFIALESGYYDFELLEPHEHNLNLMARNVKIDRDKVFYVEDMFEILQTQHDLSNVSLNTDTPHIMFQEVNGGSNPSYYSLKHLNTMYLAEGDYNVFLRVDPLNEFAYDYLIAENIKINKDTKFIWNGTGKKSMDENGTAKIDVTIQLQNLMDQEKIQLDFPVRKLDRQLDVIVPHFLNTLTEGTKMLLVKSFPDTLVNVEYHAGSSETVLTNERGYAVIHLKTPLKLGETILLNSSNYHFEGGDRLYFDVKETQSMNYDESNDMMEVAPTKVFKVRLNHKILATSLDEHDVQVRNANGELVPVEATLLADQKSIEVKPSLPYTEGEIYSLTVLNDLMSETGQALKKGKKIYFIVK